MTLNLAPRTEIVLSIGFTPSNKPSLKFLEKYNLEVIKEVIRLAMCADGCIAVSKKNETIFKMET